ncbi:MAG: glutaredoxin family protein [Terrimesophilobacter sp.]
MTAVQLTLIGKPDCHLCDVAQGVIDDVLNDLGDQVTVTLEKRSILDDPQLHDLYWEKIPVLLIDGDEHAHWRVNAEKLRSALEGSR